MSAFGNEEYVSCRPPDEVNRSPGSRSVERRRTSHDLELPGLGRHDVLAGEISARVRRPSSAGLATYTAPIPRAREPPTDERARGRLPASSDRLGFRIDGHVEPRRGRTREHGGERIDPLLGGRSVAVGNRSAEVRGVYHELRRRQVAETRVVLRRRRRDEHRDAESEHDRGKRRA